MTTYVALLRGVNVGGHNRVAMADLRAVCGALGHTDVRTYVQSGNVVLANDQADADAVATGLARALEDELGVTAAVLVRTADELVAVAAANPFGEAAAADPTKVHAAFLTAEPADPAAFAIDPEAFAPEAVVAGDRVLYLHLPGGIGRSRLATELSRRPAGVELTVRNWRTVEQLLALVGA